MAGTKFTPRLRRQEANEELEKTGMSLREQFEEERKTEVKVERRSVQVVLTILEWVKNILCAFLALTGAITLIHPDLQHAFVILVKTFLMEIWVHV